MSERKFTPAPWCAYKTKNGYFEIADKSGRVIAEVDDSHKHMNRCVIGAEAHANIKIIEAAPELLEACERALQVLEQENIFGQARLLLVVALKKALS